MTPYDKEIESIKNQILKKYNPTEIILFGSCAKRRISKRSDIDMCVILETNDKRKTLRSILVEIEYDVDLDVVIYTPDEWQKYKNDKATFAGLINKTGVRLFD